MSSQSSGSGSVSSGGSTSSSSADLAAIKVSVSPLLRETIERKLAVGSTLTARVIEAHGGGKFTVGFAGLRMMAESTLNLQVGSRIPAQVMALDPRIHLKILDPQGDGGLDRILERNGYSKPSPELRELVSSLMERGLPIDHDTLQRGMTAMSGGLAPRAAARFVAAETALSEAVILRARGAERSVADALGRLTAALEGSGRGSESSAVREAISFRGNLGELLARHPLGAERRLLSADPAVAERPLDLQSVLDRFAGSGEKSSELRRAAEGLRSALVGSPTAENAASATKSLGDIFRILGGTGRAADLEEIRRALGGIDLAREFARPGGLKPEGALRLLLDSRAFLNSLKTGGDPELSRLAEDAMRRLESPKYLEDAELRGSLEQIQAKLVSARNDGGATRVAALLAELRGGNSLGFGPAGADHGLLRELAAHGEDPRALLLKLASDSDPSIATSAKELLEALEGNFLFGDPEPNIPFVVEDDGPRDGSLIAERAPEKTYVRFRLETSKLGPVVGVLDFQKRNFGMALGAVDDSARQALRKALPDLNKAMTAMGFQIDSVTIDRRDSARDSARALPPLGLDIKA